MLFTQAVRCRDPVTDWLIGALATLALAQIPLGMVNPGCVAAGVLAVSGAFPAAALAGLGLDLAQVTKVPMTAAVCLAWFIRLIPFDKRWQHYAAPGFGALAVMAACGIWDWNVLPGLVLGGGAAALLPARTQIPRRRGETGAAQVRLEVGAEMFFSLRQLLTEMEPPAVDAKALLERAQERACGTCSARSRCTQRLSLSLEHLEHPLEADCRKPGEAHPSAAPCPGAAPGAGSQSKTPAGIPAGSGAAIYVSGGVFAKSCGRAPPEGPASPAGISGSGRRPEPGERAGQRGSVHCLSRS